MTERQAYRETVKKWEWIVEHGGRDSVDMRETFERAPRCGFCALARQRVIYGKPPCTKARCPIVAATGRPCDKLSVYKLWVKSSRIPEIRLLNAKAVLAYLRKLGRREGWS